jgi:hypothetical protein
VAIVVGDRYRRFRRMAAPPSASSRCNQASVNPRCRSCLGDVTRPRFESFIIPVAWLEPIQRERTPKKVRQIMSILEIVLPWDLALSLPSASQRKAVPLKEESGLVPSPKSEALRPEAAPRRKS